MTDSIKIPSVFSCERKLSPSDATMFATTWAERNSAVGVPVRVREKSVRGTISHIKKKDAGKLDAKIESPNLQDVDCAAMPTDKDTLSISFTLRAIPDLTEPSASNSPEFERLFRERVSQYSAQHGFRELARRYVFNLANARFAWRNRVGVEDMEVVIHHRGSEWIFDASEFPLARFDVPAKYEEAIEQIAKSLASVLTSENKFALFKVTAHLRVGEGQEVFPSQELIMDAKKKTLYSVDGVAGIHSQKIGNAVRSVDTWYPEYSAGNLQPIAAEIFGAVTSKARAYRNPKDKVDFYTRFEAFINGAELAVEEEHYVMAVIIRGGVFGCKGA